MADTGASRPHPAGEHADTAPGGAPPPHEVRADVVNISQGAADVVKADEVYVSMGAVNTVYAEKAHVEMGAVALVDCDTLDVERAAVGVGRARELRLEGGGAGLVVADRAELNNARTLVLLSREVNGTVETVLDTRGAALAGIMAGLGVGLMLIIGGLLGRRGKS